MNFIKYMTILAAAAGTMTACQELEQVQMFAPEDVVPPVLHSLPSEIAITAENMATPVTFTWNTADFGVSTQVNYSIEAAYGSDTLALFTGISGTSSEQTYESLNAPLSLDKEHGGLGLPAGTPTDVKFMISATAGTGQAKYYSEAVVSKVTVTVAERVYPMIYVIGDYCGWADDKMQKLFSFAGDEIIYSGVVDFGEKAANGFKIKGTATGWDDKSNWGLQEENAETEPATLQLWPSGGSKNIMNYSHRFYRFAFDRSSLVLSKQFSCDKIGVIGDAVGSWDNDLVMDFDAQKQKFWVDVTLSKGEMKFRADGAWTLSWGVNAATEDAVSGVLDGGNNIKVPAGNYRIYLNLNNPDEMTFELNAGDYGTGGTPEPEPEPEPDPLPEGARPIKVLMKSMDWTVNNLYGWGMATELSWPGVAADGSATLGGQAYQYWTLAAENWGKTGVGLIFNNDSEQTINIEDVVLDGDKCYELGAKNGEGKFEYSETALPTVKIVYKNEANWEKVNIYGWGSEGVSFTLGDWPGTAITQSGSEWVIELPAEHIGKSVSLIFNNGDGSQTVDLGPFVLDKDFSFDNSNAQIK